MNVDQEPDDEPLQSKLQQILAIHPHLLKEIQMKTLYVTSRTRHASTWRFLSARYPAIRATWIYGEINNTPESWKRSLDEISTSSALLLFAGIADQPLKGAFVEVGMAIAKGIPVFVLFDVEPVASPAEALGKWVNHPLVTVLGDDTLSLEGAVRLILSLPPFVALTPPASPPCHLVRSPCGVGECDGTLEGDSLSPYLRCNTCGAMAQRFEKGET